MQHADTYDNEQTIEHTPKLPFLGFLHQSRAAYFAELTRLVLFVAAGVTCTLINLVCVWLFLHQQKMPYVVSVALATEISAFSSFMLNDGITFRSLARHGHRWLHRCLRFHGASALGILVTISLSTGLYHLAHLRPLIAQLIAILVASGINFVIHRIWTYQHVRPLLTGSPNSGPP